MKKFFPSLQKYNNIIFLDNAAGSQVPKQVLKYFNNNIINNYVQPGYNNFLSKKLDNEIYNSIKFINLLINNNNGKIIIGPSTSQIIYNLSNSLKYNFINNDEIILSKICHESTLTPFERIISPNKLKWWDLDINNRNNIYINYNNLFEKICKNTKLLVLPHASNVLGNVLDLKYIIKNIKTINPEIKILVDGVAYAPHNIIDVNELDVDYYVFSFYKFCGLRVSVLYCKNECMNDIENQNHYFLENEKKLEIGGKQYELVTSINGVSKYINELNNLIDNSNYKGKINREIIINVMKNINKYEQNLIDLFRNKINKEEITIVEDSEKEKVPIFALDFKNYDNKNIELILNELGFICTSGKYYCNRLFDDLKLKNDSVLRLSFMHYNTIDEINSLVSILNLFKKFNMKFNYKINYKNNITNIKKYFSNMEIDKYYDNERYRAYSLVKVDNNENINILGDLSFYQSSNLNTYNGNNLRSYKNIDKNLLENKEFKNLINLFNKEVSKEFGFNNEYINIHQIRVTANIELTNLIPEGIHQDGYNLVAIVCISRENIEGGENKLYDIDKNLIDKRFLEEGDMLIINDNKLFHEITDIKIKDKNFEGYRDIFVFTTIN